MKKYLAILLAVVIMGLAVGCAGGANSREAWSFSGKTATFTVRDISSGTGYSWKYTISNPDVLAYQNEKSTPAANGLVGAAGVLAINFTGLAEGNTSVILYQVAPGGTEQAADGDRIRYEVQVGADGTIKNIG